VFKNHEDALQKLIKEMPISKMRREGNWVVLAISIGGIHFAKELAVFLNCDSDYLFTEKIYAPNNEDTVIAIVSEADEIVINEELVESFDISYDYIYGEAQRKHDDKVLGYFYKYRQGEIISNVKGKNILLVDEGADTGMTLAVGLKTAINLGAAKVAVAIPIMPESISVHLEKIADEVYAAQKIKHYIDVHSYYQELPNYEVSTMGGLDGKYCKIK